MAVGTIDSMELSNSEALLLLSIQDQRRLGLQLELHEDGPDRVFSRRLGGFLKMEHVNGLLCIHLLPSHIAMLSHHDDEACGITSEAETSEPVANVGLEQSESATTSALSDMSENYLKLDESPRSSRDVQF